MGASGPTIKKFEILKSYYTSNYNFKTTLNNEQFHLRSTNTSPDAQLDIKAEGFWTWGVMGIF